MKAAAVHGAHDLRLEERPRPRPAANDVLVAVEWGGICGSDISYVAHGASGTATLKQPLILGHEVAGRVIEVGADAPESLLGQNVAVYPASLPEGASIDASESDRMNRHPEVRYLGSAAQIPHNDGGFCQLLRVRSDQAIPLPPSVDTQRGALAEPLAVALHAIHRARSVAASSVDDADVIVNGCGPIGLLIIGALSRRAAGKVIAADIAPSSLAIASQMGADEIIDVSRERIAHHAPIVFESSGSPRALEGALAATTPGGTLVQVGNLPKTPAPSVLGDLITREITWIGSFRFHDEMHEAISLLKDGLDVDPLITHQFDLSDVHHAFDVAMDPTVPSSKVMLRLR
ncbi:L-idonate 5-dehydrogenase [Nesterenkonia suensis]